MAKARDPEEKFNVLLYILEIGSDFRVTAVCSEWNWEEKVYFSLADISDPEVLAKAVPGAYLLAKARLRAERKEDLNFSDFKLPRLPDEPAKE